MPRPEPKGQKLTGKSGQANGRSNFNIRELSQKIKIDLGMTYKFRTNENGIYVRTADDKNITTAQVDEIELIVDQLNANPPVREEMVNPLTIQEITALRALLG